MASFSGNTFAFHCNGVVDPSIGKYIYNLTSSYTDTSNESSVVATSVIMLVLAAVFFSLNLFSRVSDVSAVLDPTVRLVLSNSLSLFLPVMSYLLSDAKNAPVPGRASGGTDLPLRARIILTWMLLVELLRKKVEAILATGGGVPDTSSIIGHVTSVLWLGSLVFFNLKEAGRRALFGTLWVVCAAKLVQRIVTAELGKRSLAFGKNARLLSSYMSQMLRRQRSRRAAAGDGEMGGGSARLKACNYVVMGEQKMVQEAGPHGYKLDLDKITIPEDSEDYSGVVTVGKIWQQLDKDKKRWARDNRKHLIESIPRLKRLSLSFALFKLLRRRLEPLPAMTNEETDDCRDLIFNGLCEEEEKDADVALFQVLNDEINFLSEYYHSVLPVMFASPSFFLINYVAVPVVVLGLCAMTVVLCGNGNVSFSFHSIWQDNYALSVGIIPLTRCLWENVLRSPQAFFATIDISISYLLFIAFIYEQVWEFIIFVLSNWFSVSLLCGYTARPSWRDSPTISAALRRINWVRSKLSNTSLIMCKQFSVLRFCWLSMTLHTVPLLRQAKRSIMERLKAYAKDNGCSRPLSNGRSAVSGTQWPPDLAQFCDSDSVAEVIATWHIATSLLEKKCHNRADVQQHADGNKTVATILSKYCAYLFAFHPELLPDDPEGTERVYKGMKKALKKALGGCWAYYLLSSNARYNRLMSLKGKANDDEDVTVVDKGVLLGKKLMEKGEEHVWMLLAQLWVELIVYIAPSGSEEQDKAHETLIQGGELVTLLWALTTHTGIARPEADILPVEDAEEP